MPRISGLPELTGARDSMRKAQLIREQMERLESAMEMAYSYSDGMPKAQRAVPDRVAELLSKLCELQDRYQAALLEAIDSTNAALDMLDGLPAREYVIMHMRYIEGETWANVARRSAYSVENVHRIERTTREYLIERYKRMGYPVPEERRDDLGPGET